MAWFSKKVKAHYINRDRASGIYTLKLSGAEPGDTISAVWDRNRHTSAAQSLETGGHAPHGIIYEVDISDPNHYKIVGTEPLSNSVARGKNTSAWWSVIPNGLWTTAKLATQKVGELLNCGFRNAEDDMLVGPHNNGSTSFWGAAYGHTLGHAFIKASEMAAVQTFSYDDLTRIKGTNFQLWTGLGERDVSTTGDTATEGIEETHLIHESLGRNRKADHYEIYQGFAKEGATQQQKENTLLKMTREEYDKFQEDSKLTDEVGAVARLEVARVRQRYEQWQSTHPRILPRRVKLNGYLGHGESDLIVKSTACPSYKDPSKPKEPTNPDATAAEKTGLPEEDDFNKAYTRTHTQASIPASTGLSEIQRAADGRVRIASAKSVSLVKEISIPVPVRIASDTETVPTNFAVDPLIEPAITDPQESTEVFDRRELYSRAHDREYVAKHPEWEYPSINETPTTGNILEKALEFKADSDDPSGVDYAPGHLMTHTHEIPAHVTMEVDEQTKSKFYKGRAGIFITDDGGVVIRDAYGSSIRMTGGNIYADCPGDILEMPGRDKVTMAGRNASMQAQQDVEVVSAVGNTRVKAHNQLSMLGGAAGSNGGVLIENKASGVPEDTEGRKMSSKGVVIKSESYLNIKTPAVGVEAANIAFSGKLSVTDLVCCPLIRTDYLHAKDGLFDGWAKYASWADHGGGSGGPYSVGPTPATISEVEGVVGPAYGYSTLKPNLTFSFNSSKEYGLELPDYGFELIEPVWQSRERLANKTKMLDWVANKLNGVTEDYQEPYPGNSLLTAETFKQLEVADTFKTTWDGTDPSVNAFKLVSWFGNFKVNGGVPSEEDGEPGTPEELI